MEPMAPELAAGSTVLLAPFTLIASNCKLGVRDITDSLEAIQNSGTHLLAAGCMLQESCRLA